MFDYKNSKKKCLILFVDMSAAYDRVDRLQLEKYLREKGILDQEKLQLLKFLLTKQKICFGSKYITTSNGVAQGSSISPALFSIYIESLIQSVESQCVDMVLYADDIVMICETEDQVIRSQESLLLWGAKHNMKVNFSKCGLLYCNWKKYLPPLSKRIMFPTVDRYMYLGAYISRDLSVDDHLSHI